MKRHDIVSRKKTTGHLHTEEDINEKTKIMRDKLHAIIKKYPSIHPALIVNMDQFGLQIAPAGNMTLDFRGAKQVPVASSGTLVFTCGNKHVAQCFVSFDDPSVSASFAFHH